ncbi:MAG: hypothetical protein GX856_04835 [Gammaproteobacteria bacterium]|nr:hypothetical protein [Gammaproteobacteria bacterium]
MTAPQGECGQASVELVALVPLLLVVALSLSALLAGFAAREAADQAAVAGAMAGLQNRDVKAAVQAASPGWARSRATISAGHVRVQVEPRVPRFAARIVAAARTVVITPGGAR